MDVSIRRRTNLEIELMQSRCQHEHVYHGVCGDCGAVINVSEKDDDTRREGPVLSTDAQSCG